MKENKFQAKQIIFAILAIASFVVILFCCMQLKAKGLPILACLVIHTCCMLLLYRDALIAIDPENWEDESDWLQEDLPEETEPASRADVPANDRSMDSIAETDDMDEYTNIHKTQKQQEEEKKQAATENFFKDLYAEVRESLVSDDSLSRAAETFPEEIPEENLFPPPTEEEKEPPLPREVSAFLSTPREVVEMDLISAARDAMESLRSFAERQKIKLNLSTTCETLMMKADPDSIRILFRNIIDNSIKYMGRPGHMIITISLLGDDIFLILKDTGMGLSEDETEHVFELNFQGSNRVSGNGLGLTQTKMIVEAFGGTIYAKSSPGNGMAIYIQLPVSGTAPQ